MHDLEGMAGARPNRADVVRRTVGAFYFVESLKSNAMPGSCLGVIRPQKNDDGTVSRFTLSRDQIVAKQL